MLEYVLTHTAWRSFLYAVNVNERPKKEEGEKESVDAGERQTKKRWSVQYESMRCETSQLDILISISIVFRWFFFTRIQCFIRTSFPFPFIIEIDQGEAWRSVRNRASLSNFPTGKNQSICHSLSTLPVRWQLDSRSNNSFDAWYLLLEDNRLSSLTRRLRGQKQNIACLFRHMQVLFFSLSFQRNTCSQINNQIWRDSVEDETTARQKICLHHC